METYRKLEKLAYGSVAFLVICAGLCIAGASSPGGLTLRALAFFTSVGVLICLLSAFHAKLRFLAEREEAERSEIGDGGIFDESGAASKVKQRNLQQFERWMMPAAVGFIGLVELVASIFLFKTAGSVAPVVPGSVPTVVGCVAVGGVAAFLFGSYLVGLSARGPERILRAAAGELAGIAWLSGATGIAFLLTLTKAGINFDLGFGRAFATILLLRAIERAVAVVMEIYRPRKKAAAERAMLYESRVNGMVADPKGLLTGVSESLNYQFGIRIDEAGLLKALTMGLPIVVAANLLVLFVYTSAVVINPGERAVLERWGRPHASNPVLEPGMHFKLPWPIDRVYRYNVKQVRTVNIQEPAPDRGLWNSASASDIDLYLTPTDTNDAAGESLNALAIELFVEYRISDVRTYLYASKDPEDALKSLAKRELTQQLGGTPFVDAFLNKRDLVAKAVQDELQKEVDENGLGMDVVAVGLRYVQPPADVVESFRKVIAKQEQGLAQILKAERETLKETAEARAKTAGLVSDAQAYHDERVSVARADAASFLRLQPAYEKYGELLKARLYFDALKGLANRRKIILATDIERQMIRLDLKKSKTELFEFNEETSK